MIIGGNRHRLLISFLLIAGNGFDIRSASAQFLKEPKASGKFEVREPISVMTFNVENLFDTKNDPDKEDHTYLPRELKKSPEHKIACKKIRGSARQKDCMNLDWSAAALATKIERLSAVILAVNDGKGPDLLFLSEVENTEVLEMLRQALKSAKYFPAVHIVGPDRRGIDVAIFSRFKLVEQAQLHLIPYTKDPGGILNSRGILEAKFSLASGENLTAFAIHFPAPYHPIDKRFAAFDHLRKLAENVAKEADIVIAGGDFNVKVEEDSTLYRQLASEHWYVSHLVGCERCLGTHYFRPKDSWSFLDAILLWRGRVGWRLDPQSIRVVNHVQGQVIQGSGIPLSFDPKAKTGVSDHLPVEVKLIKVDLE